MSTVSDIFTSLKSIVQTALPNHNWLQNPRDIADNENMTLRQGVGLAYGPANTAPKTICGFVCFQRTFSVTITRATFSTDLNREAREEVEKQMLEDQLLVIKDFMKDPLSLLALVVAKSIWQSDNGIEEVFSGSERFLKVTTVFSVDYNISIN